MTAPCPECGLDFYADPACRCGTDWGEQLEVYRRGAASARALIVRPAWCETCKGTEGRHSEQCPHRPSETPTEESA